METTKKSNNKRKKSSKDTKKKDEEIQTLVLQPPEKKLTVKVKIGGETKVSANIEDVKTIIDLELKDINSSAEYRAIRIKWRNKLKCKEEKDESK